MGASENYIYLSDETTLKYGKIQNRLIIKIKLLKSKYKTTDVIYIL